MRIPSLDASTASTYVYQYNRIMEDQRTFDGTVPIKTRSELNKNFLRAQFMIQRDLSVTESRNYAYIIKYHSIQRSLQSKENNTKNYNQQKEALTVCTFGLKCLHSEDMLTDAKDPYKIRGAGANTMERK